MLLTDWKIIEVLFYFFMIKKSRTILERLNSYPIWGINSLEMDGHLPWKFMKITKFIKVTWHSKYHMIEGIVLIFFELEINRRHHKWYVFNSHMNNYYLLTIDFDCLEKLLS